jgi:hypothetical protein
MIVDASDNHSPGGTTWIQPMPESARHDGLPFTPAERDHHGIGIQQVHVHFCGWKEFSTRRPLCSISGFHCWSFIGTLEKLKTEMSSVIHLT